MKHTHYSASKQSNEPSPFNWFPLFAFGHNYYFRFYHWTNRVIRQDNDNITCNLYKHFKLPFISWVDWLGIGSGATITARWKIHFLIEFNIMQEIHLEHLTTDYSQFNFKSAGWSSQERPILYTHIHIVMWLLFVLF